MNKTRKVDLWDLNFIGRSPSDRRKFERAYHQEDQCLKPFVANIWHEQSEFGATLMVMSDTKDAAVVGAAIRRLQEAFPALAAECEQVNSSDGRADDKKV